MLYRSCFKRYHRIRWFFCALLFVLNLPATGLLAADSQDLQKGLSAYQQRKFDQAWYYLEPLANQGNVEAQRKLGVMYRHGLGVQQNDELAIKWYRKAAEGGHVRAQNSLGIMYRFGMGVRKDVGEAAKWLSAAAEQGDAKAQENIALMYLDGDGVKQSDSKAVGWLVKAAEQGQVKAQLTLGLMTLAGRGTSRNPDQGMDWIMQSTNRGYRPAAEALARAYAEGLYGLARDPERARYWYRRAGKSFE